MELTDKLAGRNATRGVASNRPLGQHDLKYLLHDDTVSMRPLAGRNLQ
jgi:hypothetical protein